MKAYWIFAMVVIFLTTVINAQPSGSNSWGGGSSGGSWGSSSGGGHK